MICERMTPEFPRAPINAARVTSLTSAARSSVVDLSSSSTTARTVIVRFVPVSPSGTGYTFRSSIRCRLRSSAASAPRASSWTRARSLTLRGPLDVLDAHLDLGDPQAGQPLDLVSDAVPQSRRDFREVEAVLDHDAELDRHAFLGAAADGDPLPEPVAG